MTEALPPQPAIFVQRLTVSDDVVDGNGHVNNVAYVRWMQDVAVEHFRSRVRQQQMTEWECTWVARSHHIEYLSPALPGDDIDLLTWIVNWRRVRSTRRYQFRRVADGALLARGETDWVLIDSVTGRPKSIPDAITTAFQLAPDGPDAT